MTTTQKSSGNKKYKKWMLYGSVLPDFINDGKTGNKWYTEKIYDQDLKEQDLYHGKNREMLNKRKVEVLKTIKENGKKKETFILIGAVLHSIEDLGAHSYAMNLQEYKTNIKNDKTYKTDPNNQWLNEYHNDSRYVNGKYKRDGELHRDQKDNPYAIFEFRNGCYVWRRNSAGVIDEVSSRMDNPRYVGAYYDSMNFLRNAIKRLAK